MSFYQLEAYLNEELVSMEKYKGQILVVVNVASKCGFTPQYKDLQLLYDNYKENGLSILGFPCNQFGGQEPGSKEQINSFCSLNFGVTFDIFDKIEVNGKNEHSIYKYLKNEKPGFAGIKAIKWNFTKFLIDRQGNVVKRYGPNTSISEIEKDLKQYL